MTASEFNCIKDSILPLAKAEHKDETPTRTELRQTAVNWALWLGMTEKETDELIRHLECNIVTVIKAIPVS